MKREQFLRALSTPLLTGGLDVWSPPEPRANRQMRVLVADDRAGETPQLADGDMFTFAGKRWRGTPSLVALPSGHSGVIATLDVDRYLYGVVPVEAPAGWPAAALEAQAIVARTFALARRTLSRSYDVVVSERDQRFGGIDAEAPQTNAAVDRTHGATLTFEGGSASVFYAACCGGHTADAAQIWGHADLPYLRGVADPFCNAAPDYRWSRRVPVQRVQAALASHLSGAITGFALGPADAAGRPVSLDVLMSSERAAFTPLDFRRLIGADTVRSTWIQTLTLDSTDAEVQVTIEGAGRGHGVGFCQWGARAMAASGRPASDILAFYFPGTVIAGGDDLGR